MTLPSNVYIFKFNGTMDYSEHMYAIAYKESDGWWCGPVQQFRPTPLHNGYFIANYLTCSAQNATENMLYLTYTLDEYFAGEVDRPMFPTGNEEFVLSRNPYAEFYYLGEDANPGNLPIAWVTDSNSRHIDRHVYVDTNILNSIIDNGELSHYFQKIK